MATRTPPTPQRKDVSVPVSSWVAIALRSGEQPPVGKVQAVDAYGIRLTHIDWLIGSASNFDVFVPWSEILFMDVATDEHDLDRFIERAAKFQEWHFTAKAKKPTEAE